MGEIETLKPFRVPMKIVALYTGGGFLEADVVEPGERGPRDVLDGVVRNQEVLLPPHVHVVCLRQRLVVEAVVVEVLAVRVERHELALKVEVFIIKVLVRVTFSYQ